MMKNISFIMLSLFTVVMLYLYPILFIHVYSQSGGGLEITPSVKWSENLAGTFSYCVYEGTVTLDSTNDPQAFCIIPTSDSPFQNMQSSVNDGVDTYVLTPIETPQGLFKDGAPYSVCIEVAPAIQNDEFTTAESCGQFINQKGHNPEKPFVDLDQGVLFRNT